MARQLHRPHAWDPVHEVDRSPCLSHHWGLFGWYCGLNVIGFGGGGSLVESIKREDASKFIPSDSACTI